MCNKSLPLVYCFLFIVAVFAFGGCIQALQEEKIKIGAIIPLTGEYARWGEFGKYGIELALEEIAKDDFFKQHSLEVVYEDSQGQASVAVTAFNKLAAVDKIKIVITSLAQVGLVIQPLANQNKIVQIDYLIVAPSYSTPNDYSFRTANSLKT